MGFGFGRCSLTVSHTGGPSIVRNRELEIKSLFSAVSPNRESSEHAVEQIRKEREIVTTPASGNVFAFLLGFYSLCSAFVEALQSTTTTHRIRLGPTT